MLDVVLTLPVILVTSFVGLALGVVFLDAESRDAFFAGEESLPLAVLAVSLVAQQVGQGSWPLVVSWWKGLGPVADWRLRYRWYDPAIGIGTAMIALGAAAVAAAGAAALVDLSDQAEADNTQFLRDAEGSPWLWVLLFGAVVGAPLTEEILYRGLILRALEKRWGTTVGVVGSTILFTLPHFTGSGLAGTVVLFASIGMVGAVLAIITVAVDRLWPAVVAHMVFNGVGVLGALGYLDQLVQQT